ncbi:hypothetical protein D3C87_1819700 [compost metagenome]
MQYQRNIEIGGSSCKERIKLLFQHIMRRISPYPDCTVAGLVQLFKLLRQRLTISELQQMQG